MQNSLKIALVVILLIYLFIILKSVKKKNMRINYLIFWSITGIILIIALLVPNFVDNVSKFLGFELPINMIFSFAIFIALYLIFDLTKLITKEQNNNITLIQEISMLKKRIDELERKNKNN
ncbi:MAG: DUF2304 domain-containing protein [Clostridia bacterium]|nr:DUF2304 domain-containing protein [Clostridia bacterium]